MTTLDGSKDREDWRALVKTAKHLNALVKIVMICIDLPMNQNHKLKTNIVSKLLLISKSANHSDHCVWCPSSYKQETNRLKLDLNYLFTKCFFMVEHMTDNFFINSPGTNRFHFSVKGNKHHGITDRFLCFCYTVYKKPCTKMPSFGYFMRNIMRIGSTNTIEKSQSAKLRTNKFEGVRNGFRSIDKRKLHSLNLKKFTKTILQLTTNNFKEVQINSAIGTCILLLAYNNNNSFLLICVSFNQWIRNTDIQSPINDII
ncbi:hypothetical protein AGLY_004294, partial [Aphis glycines]